MTEHAFEYDSADAHLAFPSIFQISNNVIWFGRYNEPDVIEDVVVLSLSKSESPRPTVDTTTTIWGIVPIWGFYQGSDPHRIRESSVASSVL